MRKRWIDVERGDRLRLKGELWIVTDTGSGTVTMRHRSLGERTGTPDPNGEVELVAELTPEAKKGATPSVEPVKRTPEELARYEDALKAASAPKSDPDLEALRDYATRQGVHTTKTKGATREELRALISAKHAERVGADNGVPLRKVEEVTLRLVLGATHIADLEEGSSRPQCPIVDAMDAQTFRNHLHFFHDVYPAASVNLEDLEDLHTDHHGDELEKVAHDHTVPF